LKKISNYKRIKGSISMDKQKDRDHLMFGFDKKLLRTMKLKMGVHHLKFSDALPNNLGVERTAVNSPVKYNFGCPSTAEERSPLLINDGSLTKRSLTKTSPRGDATDVFNYRLGTYEASIQSPAINQDSLGTIYTSRQQFAVN
jgi:hypothetical protein